MKKILSIAWAIVVIFIMTIFSQSCSCSKELIASKSGAQLWGENCIRCHNSPSPVDFTDVQWKTTGLHMQIRANITKDEVDKIIGFLQSAN